MKKKFLVTFLSLVSVIACALGLSACSGNSGGNGGDADKEKPVGGHEHTYSQDWSYDDAYHWHAATCEHKNEVKDKAEHDFTNGNCVCGKAKPVQAHSHVWSQNWESNGTHHWHNCTADGCNVTDNAQKNGYAEHDFTNGNCVCGKEKPVSPAEVTTGQWQSVVTDLGVIGINSNVTLTTYLPDGSKYYTYEIGGGKNKILVAGASENSAIYIEWDKSTYNDQTKECGCKQYRFNDSGWQYSITELPLDIDWDLQLFVFKNFIYDNFEYVAQTAVYRSKQNVTVRLTAELGVEVSDISLKFDNGKLIEAEGNFVQIRNGNRENLGVLKYEFTKYNETTVTLPKDATESGGEKQPTEGIVYLLNSDKESYCVSSGKDVKDTEIIIASVYNEMPVTKIANKAFSGCSNITSVTIPETVTSIEYDAFADCSALADITVPDSVTYVGWDAFDGTAWYNNQPDGPVYAGKVIYKYKGTMPLHTSITIAEGTVSIAQNAFSNCDGLEELIIPDTVKEIGINAFNGCDFLMSVIIPDSVITIGYGAFSYCTRLINLTIGSGVTTIAYKAFERCPFSQIKYNGTKEQWQAIKKVEDWNYNTDNYTIVFSDGTTLAKDKDT